MSVIIDIINRSRYVINLLSSGSCFMYQAENCITVDVINRATGVKIIV